MQGNPAFIDASAVLNQHPEDVFQDLGHVSADGAPAVGEFIAGEILTRLHDHAPPRTAAGDEAKLSEGMSSRSPALPTGEPPAGTKRDPVAQ